MDVSFLILLGFLAIMYFVMIRPQQKRQREHQQMVESLTPGADVVTIGGLHGRVAVVASDHVDLEVTDEVVLRFQKNAIAKVLAPEDELEVLEDESEDDNEAQGS